MYCSHCGFEIDEHKIEQQSSSFSIAKEADLNTTVNYVCPRCGHLIHDNLNNDEVKSLTRACHAEVQRSKNSTAKGMSALSFGVILLVIGIVFLLLSKKADNQHMITVTSPEFWIALVLMTSSVILLVSGCIFTIKGFVKNRKYSDLLNDINNKTFVQ